MAKALDTNTFNLQDAINAVNIIATAHSNGSTMTSLSDLVNKMRFQYWYMETNGSTANDLLSFKYYSRNVGYLYNQYCTINADFPPSGWRIPDDTDYDTLMTFLGGSSVAGTKLKTSGSDHWTFTNSGTNSSGFSGVSTGYRYANGSFDGEGINGCYISSVYLYRLIPNSASVAIEFPDPKAGYAVRFIKNDSTNPGTITDYDGNTYQCVTIGTQVWTMYNWRCTHFNNGTAIANVTDATAWSNLTTPAYCGYLNGVV